MSRVKYFISPPRASVSVGAAVHPKPRRRQTALTALLGLSALALAPALTARAGSADFNARDDSKGSKAVIQPPPPAFPRFFLSLAGGAEFDEHATKFISNGEGTLGAVRLGGAALPVKITSKDFHNTHEVTASARAEAGYRVTEWLALFVGFTYDHAQGDSAVRFGQVRDPAGLAGDPRAVRDLYANLGNYEAYAGRGGFKLALPRTVLNLIHAPQAIKPYLSYSAGGKYVEPTRAQFFSPGLLDTGNLRLYDASWVFTTDLQSGLEVALTRSATVFFESGYGYDTKLQRNSSGGSSPAAAGLTGVNRGGDRFYSTVSLGAKLRF